jgi:hypothetical protein
MDLQYHQIFRQEILNPHFIRSVSKICADFDQKIFEQDAIFSR